MNNKDSNVRIETIRQVLQRNDAWFPDIMEHLQYRYFLEGYAGRIEPIEHQTIQIVSTVSFGSFVREILGIELDTTSFEPFFSFNKPVDIIDNHILHNYCKEEE